MYMLKIVESAISFCAWLEVDPIPTEILDGISITTWNQNRRPN